MIYSYAKNQSRQKARNFVQNNMRLIHSAQNVDSSTLDFQVKQLGDSQLSGMMVSTLHKDKTSTTVDYLAALEEISKVDNNYASLMLANNSILCWSIEKYGTSLQKQKYLPKLIAGELMGDFCWEVPNAKPPICLKTKDYYSVSGMVSSQVGKGIFLIVAPCFSSTQKPSFHAFLIDSNWRGVYVWENSEENLPNSKSKPYLLHLQNVKIPKAQCLTQGNGLQFTMELLDSIRLGSIAQALGIATGVYELVLSAANKPTLEGKLLKNRPSVALTLKRIKQKINTIQQMASRVAWSKDRGMDFAPAAMIVKHNATKLARGIIQKVWEMNAKFVFLNEGDQILLETLEETIVKVEKYKDNSLIKEISNQYK